MKTDRKLILIIGLLLVSFFIRIYKTDNLSLFGDEIDVGYQAYSLLNTAHDYRGYFLPFYTESLSESRAPLLIYLTIPFVKLFGLNPLSVRLVPAIFGVISILFLYKLVYLLSKSKSLALVVSFIFSLLPWHILYSRASFEVTLLVSLILAGTYYFYLFIEKNKSYHLFLSIFIFGLSFYTYNTANIFTPLLVLYLLITNDFLRKKLKAKNLFFAIIFTLIMISPIVKEIFWGKASERFSSISIINNQTIIDEIITKRTSFSSVQGATERIFHNKLLAVGHVFLKNYFQSISPSFLFFNENQLNLRHSISSTGLLFITLFPLLIFGLTRLDIKNNYHRFFLYWFFISPIPSALTLNGGTHPTRLFLMTVPLSFFISLSIEKILTTKFSTLIFILISLPLILEMGIFGHEYFIHYPKDNPKLWNAGYQEIFQDLNKTNSGRIFISNTNYNSLLSYLFYNQILPNSIDLDDHEKPNIYSDLSGFNISDSIYFINNWQHNNDIFQKLNTFAQKNDLFILFQLNEIPGDMNLSLKPVDGFKTIKTIYNPDQTILGQIIQKI